MSLGHLDANSCIFSLNFRTGIDGVWSPSPRKFSILSILFCRKKLSFFIQKSIIALLRYYTNTRLIKIPMSHRASLNIQHKNPNHSKDMDSRLAEFIAIIKKEQQEEIDKMDSKGKVECLDARNKIVNQGVEREEEVARKKNLGVDTEAKIRKSAKINESRMDMMKARYELIQKMKAELLSSLNSIINDQAKYKNLLQKLIVQGMFKLMDAEVEVKCLRKDVDLIKSILKPAEEEFNKLSQEQTTTKTRSKLTLNTVQFIDDERKNSLGGVVLTSYNGRIVCVNTLDTRFKYCVQEMLPQLRDGLFGKK